MEKMLSSIDRWAMTPFYGSSYKACDKLGTEDAQTSHESVRLLCLRTRLRPHSGYVGTLVTPSGASSTGQSYRRLI